MATATSMIRGLCAVLQGTPITVAPAFAMPHHDFADGFAGIFVRLPKQKARSVDDMSEREYWITDRCLIAVRFGLIKNLAHEVQTGIRPHPPRTPMAPVPFSLRCPPKAQSCCEAV